MFLINYLNRNITDQYYPLYEIIYSFEVILLVCQICVTFPMISTLWMSYFHLNIRLRLCVSVAVPFFCVIARLIVIAHQICGTSEYVELPYLIVCSIIREAYLAYFTTLITFISTDRWAATIAWSWYESGVPSTLLLYLGEALILFSLSIAMSTALVFDYVTDFFAIGFYGFGLVVGSVNFYFVLMRNIREMEILKKGACINSYSIARTYQVKENLAILKFGLKLTTPLVAASSPAFLFYGFWTCTKRIEGIDGLRYFSVSMYDLWLAIMTLVVIMYLPIAEPRFVENLSKFPILGWIYASKLNETYDIRNASTNADLYFDMLINDWQRPR